MAKKDYSFHQRINSTDWKRFQEICSRLGLKAGSVINLFIVSTNRTNGQQLATLLENPDASNRI